MKFRIALTVFVFVVSFMAVAIGAVHMQMALDAFAPLDPAHLGPNVPGVTQMAVKDLPRYPAIMGVVAALTAGAAIYFWRSRRPLETKLFAVAMLACANLYAAFFGATWFLQVYFVAPRIANSV